MILKKHSIPIELCSFGAWTPNEDETRVIMGRGQGVEFEQEGGKQENQEVKKQGPCQKTSTRYCHHRFGDLVCAYVCDLRHSHIRALLDLQENTLLLTRYIYNNANQDLIFYTGRN